MKTSGYHQNSETAMPAGRAVVQCKLTVGSANDAMEHQADAMADRVMQAPANPFVQRKSSSCCDYDDDHVRLKPEGIKPFIQAKENSASAHAANNSVSSQIEASRGGGNAMGESTKSFMEHSFGTDF